MSQEALMVSVSGIRGRVGYSLTPEIVANYAAGFGAWSAARGKARAIVVGRDSRVSGPMFHRAVVSALQSVGCTIIDIGMTTTPTCQLAVEHHRAAGGLMISASHNPVEWKALKFIAPTEPPPPAGGLMIPGSHNPVEWNALKFIAPTGLFLDAAEGTQMRALIDG